MTNGAYTYDANGNMASSVPVNRIFTYTSFNLPSRIFNQNSISDFIYDADHNRISESYVNGTIIYVALGSVRAVQHLRQLSRQQRIGCLLSTKLRAEVRAIRAFRAASWRR